ncbi:MAG: acetylxylan esterase [Oscillospiraceae bacterium]|nr:acetylxylan esterase [Oscillospiraceae bacterium]
MPKIDMPLNELYQYQGRNPKPADFDAYWDRGLAEMRAVDPKMDLAPATFTCSFADCYDMTFTGVRNARIYAKLLKPKNANAGAAAQNAARSRPALLLFHGYSGSSGDWFSMLPYAAEGFVVAALDCRGQGGLSEDTGGVVGNTYEGQIVRGLNGDPDNMLMRHIMLDTAQLAGLVMAMDEVDPDRIMAAGGSQGGGLTLACAALAPSIMRLAPCYPFLCDYQRVWEMDLAKAAYDELTFYFKRFDPRHLREHEVFTQLGYVDVQHLAPRIRGEVLLACGLMDEVCPPSTQFAAYNKITSKKDVVLYPDFGHEGLAGWNDLSFSFLASQ